MNEDVESIISRYTSLKGQRETNWDTYIQECADLVIPRHNQVTEKNSPGLKRRLNIYDTTAIIANERLAAGLFSYLTPPDQRWFEFQVSNKKLKDNENVKRYFQEVTEITYQEIAKSNFALQAHELYLTLGFAGIGDLYLEDGEKTLLNFRNIHYSLFVFEEGKDGVADTVIREFKFTARQAVDEWGEENLSTKITECAKDAKKQDDPFTFIHAVFPRIKRDEDKIDDVNKPFASIYIELEQRHLISRGGFDENPHAVPRFVKDPKEKQGRSPAMSVLESIKMANAMKLTMLRVSQKVSDPPTLVPAIDIPSKVNTGAGKIMYYKPNAFGAKPEPWPVGGNIPITMEIIEGERKQIRQAFYEDLFTLLISNQDNEKTAFEVDKLIEEQVTIFAPTWGRLQPELYNPLLTRSVGMLDRAGAFPERPEELLDEAIGFDIEYIGRLAIKIKSTQLKALFSTIELIAPLAEAHPEILDWFIFDKMPKFAAERFGAPISMIRDEQAVKELRAERAEAVRAQQDREDKLELAKSVDKIASAAESNGEILEQLQGGGIG
jgi:hypothetical protein